MQIFAQDQATLLYILLTTTTTTGIGSLSETKRRMHANLFCHWSESYRGHTFPQEAQLHQNFLKGFTGANSNYPRPAFAFTRLIMEDKYLFSPC